MKDNPVVYVCYYDYGGWDSCSHPVRIFYSRYDAEQWVKKNEGVFQEMEYGREYLPR